MKCKLGLVGLMIVATTSLIADANAQSAAPMAADILQASTDEMTAGEVRKIDKENQKITLKHGEIKNLEMPGMTMVFRVKDPALLDLVKPGEKVMFRAEKADGALVVTAIHPIK